MSRPAMILCAVLLALAAVPAPGQAQKNKNDEKREDARVKAAKKDLDEASDKLKDAQRELDQAVGKLKKAEKERESAIDRAQNERTKAEREHEGKLGIPKALETQEKAQQAYDSAAVPVLAALKKSAEYLAALESAARAKEELKLVRENTSLAAAEREARLSQLTRTALAPAELEKKTLESDPETRKAAERLAAARAELAKLRAEIRAKVESDPQLRDALADLERANKEHDKAEAEAVREKKSVAEAQARVAREKNAYNQAVAADRRDDNKGKK
jgi:hypothetical protein